MTDPAQPVQATPETDGLGNALGSVYSLRFPSGHEYYDFVSEESYRNLERRLQLAQTENAGHIRIEDELKAVLEVAEVDQERSYQVLELYGVSRERAKSVSNGIDVLATRFDKQHYFYQQALARAEQAEARCAELEKLLAEAVKDRSDANYTLGTDLVDRIDAALAKPSSR